MGMEEIPPGKKIRLHHHPHAEEILFIHRGTGVARLGARELVSAVAEEEAARLGVRYERIRIGGQRTLWGSCSSRGTLSFNWRLVLAPPEVLDYVVVHELCHLRVPNHSRRFWALVERQRPHWREQRAWLREHGPELLAFNPGA